MDNEDSLFRAANKLRGKIPPSDYKFYVLPLVYIRYLSEKNKTNVWTKILDNCSNKDIFHILDVALLQAIPAYDNMNNSYDNMYSNSNLSSQTIKELILLMNEIKIDESENKIDYLGQIYEYFIGNFAATEGNRGGEFFTPPSVVELLVQMLDPQGGIVYDPACGTGGIFVQSNKYNKKKMKFIGQEQNSKTIMLAYMNSVLHNLDLTIKKGDTLLNDLFPELKADYVISNPPFNMKDWGADQIKADDPRVIGKVNKNNANYMWVQHFLYHLKEGGKAGFVISNGALTSSNEADFFTRRQLIRDNKVDCVVQLPEKMFLGTAIPSALIFLDTNRICRNTILFIDASRLGKNVSKTQKILSPDDIETICNVYRLYKKGGETNINKRGFCWVATNDDIVDNTYKLMPSIYTGIEEKEINQEENKRQIAVLKQQLKEQIRRSNQLAQNLIWELK